MSPSCHPVISQSSEAILQSTANNHELVAITQNQDKKGKQKTSPTVEVNEFDKACLDLLKKKSNNDTDAHFYLSLMENLESLPPKKDFNSKENNDSFH